MFFSLALQQIPSEKKGPDDFLVSHLIASFLDQVWHQGKVTSLPVDLLIGLFYTGGLDAHFWFVALSFSFCLYLLMRLIWYLSVFTPTESWVQRPDLVANPEKEHSKRKLNHILQQMEAHPATGPKQHIWNDGRRWSVSMDSEGNE